MAGDDVTEAVTEAVTDGPEGAAPIVRRGGLPAHFGPWRVERALGRGGMGEVFLARHADGRRAAIKRAASPRPTHVRALRREADALAGLDHPGIARLIDRGEDAGRPWYAMVHVDGPDLGAWAAARPPAARLAALVGLCEALAWLHRAGGVHRDVKPGNVLMADGRPVLIDFGLLVHIGGERPDEPGWARDDVHGAPDAAGTDGYRAPEQRAGGWFDGRADLYAVGRILADWLATWPAAPAAVVALGRALLAEDPADRPGDAGHVALRLAPFAGLDPAPIAARLAELGPGLHRAALAGRAAEVAALGAALERARRGEGGVVLLSGPSGIGKTRLALEAGRLAEGFRAVAGECRAAGGLLHGLAGLIQAAVDRCRGDAARTLATFDVHGPTLVPFAPAVADLPGQAALAPARPDAARVAAAVARVVDGLAASRPLLLIVDDVQWADGLTAAALAHLADTPRRALVVLTARSETDNPALAPLLAHPRLARHGLSPLSTAEAGALVGRLLGWRDPPPGLVREVARRAEGSPFFVAEVLRAMIADGRLAADPVAGWAWRGPSPEAALPGPVEAVIGRRLAVLGPPARALAEAAAVLGRAAPIDRIAAVLGAPVARAPRAELVRRAVCAEVGEGLRFAHDRLREALYRALDPDRRAALHRRAAEDLEARPPADAYAAARALALHRDGAGEPRAAGRALMAAGHAAEDRRALEDAARHFAGAAARLEGADRVEARLAQAQCLDLLGRRTEAVEVQRAAADEARAAADARLEARCLSALGRSLEFVDRVDEAEASLRRALALFEAHDDGPGVAATCTRLALLQQHRGALDAAEALHRRALALRTAAGDPVGMASTGNNLAVLAGDRGRYAEAVALLDEALAAMRRAERPLHVLAIEAHRAYALHRAGRVDEADAAFDRALAALEAAQMHPHRALVLLRRAALHRQVGRPLDAGFAALDEAAAVFAGVDDPLTHGALACEVGHHRLAAGRDAADALAQARRHFAAIGVDAQTPALAGWTLGWLEAAQAAFAEGRPLFRGQVWGTIYPGVRAWLGARGAADPAGDGAQRSTQV